MGSSENFCLRWNDFETNVSSAFRELRAESDLFDVTLTCDDTPSTQRPLQAHKVILSACSSLFKTMLKSNGHGHPNPLIYLRGVKTAELESVIDFMYHGEVNVAQADLNSFLAVAEDLQIKGLTQGTAAQQQQAASSSSSGGVARRKKMSAVSSPAAKRRRANDDGSGIKINVKDEPLIDPAAAASGASASTSQAVTEDDYEQDAGGAAPDDFGDGGGYEEAGEGYADYDIQDPAGGGETGAASGSGAAGTSEQDSTKGRRSSNVRSAVVTPQVRLRFVLKAH